MVQVVHRVWLRLLPFQILLITSALGLTVGVTGAMIMVLLHGNVQPAPLPVEIAHARIIPTSIAPVFTSEVQYWNKQIMKWSQKYDVDPNILATIMQIESCGDYLAGSSAGAQGLFQLMPDHFKDGEDPHNPDTNALRGVEYIKGGLALADGHVGLALAGYNGGWGKISEGWAGWAPETRLYYIWGTQIYEDAISGKTTDQSQGLQSWLNAGGVYLCKQANTRLFGTPTPIPGTGAGIIPITVQAPAGLPIKPQ